MMIALAALKNWHITRLDVESAFLYGELNEELYMEQPEGFKIKGQEHKVMCLKHAIYGLKQAALAWWKALDESMATLGCTLLLSGILLSLLSVLVSLIFSWNDHIIKDSTSARRGRAGKSINDPEVGKVE